jgi:nucleotide-binding universal stress UspA family protein
VFVEDGEAGVGAGVVRSLLCPSAPILVRTEMQLKSRVVVIGLDFSSLGDRAFRQGYELAVSSPASELHAVLVVPALAMPEADQDTSEPPHLASFEKSLAQLSKHVGALLASVGGLRQSALRVYSHLRVDAPLVGITQLAAELQAHFIVLGSHRRHGWLIGSVAEGVVRHAPCPVLVIPPDASVPELPRMAVACSLCAQVRRQSRGRDLWCAAHDRQRSRHTFYHHHERSSDTAVPRTER